MIMSKQSLLQGLTTDILVHLSEYWGMLHTVRLEVFGH